METMTEEKDNSQDFVLVDVDEVEIEEIEDGSTGRGKKNLASLRLRRLLLVILPFALLAIYFSFYSVTSFEVSGFSGVPVGSFFGEVSGAPFDSDESPLNIYLEHSPNHTIGLGVFVSGWRFSSTALEKSGEDDTFSSPSLRTGAGLIRLTGAHLGSGIYGGEIVNLDTGVRGTWQARKLESGTAQENDKALQRWLLLSAELQETKLELKSIEAEVTKDRKRIEQLSKTMTDKDKVKELVVREYQDIQKVLEERSKLLKEKESEISQLRTQFEIAQTVTPRGKLASLSRESIERETRWYESMMRGGGELRTRTVDDEYSRALRIIELRQEIGRYRALLGYKGSPGGFRSHSGGVRYGR